MRLSALLMCGGGYRGLVGLRMPDWKRRVAIAACYAVLGALTDLAMVSVDARRRRPVDAKSAGAGVASAGGVLDVAWLPGLALLAVRGAAVDRRRRAGG